ncbi:MAG: hypothetical protein SFW64_08420 [Alphaproteobacteria bacterium]|nr:hypothetical protein [Alphaproteobacteria bacterium]
MAHERKGTGSEGGKHWLAIRQHVVPRHLLKPLDELELAIGSLDALLNPPSARRQQEMSHVAYQEARREAVPVEQKRTEFEAIIAKTEAVLRQLRIEQGMHSSDYEQPMLQPMLEKLQQAMSVEEDLQHRNLALNNTHASTERMNIIDGMRRKLREAADAFGEKVTVDSLWQAYASDFRKNGQWLSVGELNENPFIQSMPATAEKMRLIARAKAMQVAAQTVGDATVDDAAAMQAVQIFLAKLPLDYLRHQPDFSARLKALVDTRDTSNPEAQAEARVQMATWLQQSAEILIRRFGAETVGSTLHSRMLDTYREDVAAYTSRFQQSELFPTTISATDQLAEVMAAAPHLREQISYLRAEAALRTIDKLLEQHWRSVEAMYPNSKGERGRVR